MPATDVPDFAYLLRHYRRRSGLTQEELAERAGLSPAAVSLLERGITLAPQKATVGMLSTALALAPDEAADFMEQARGPRRTEETSHTVSETPLADNLPVPLTPLIGREREETALVELLADSTTRLLTLTGPAGVGKTRLAVHVASILRHQLARDVVFVELIPVPEPQRVLAAIAQTLGIQDSGIQPLHESLVQFLRERRLMLVLDNFEQVLPAARGVLEVLVACPGVQALVTSRAALNVRGERCYPVSPLALPDQAQMHSLDALRRVPTVALFLERVTAAQPGFALARLDDGRLVAEICQRLDGLPLAVELAAARVRHLGLRQLHERLAQPAFLGMLGEGPQDLADHQRTMRSTIAWSFNLLEEQERRLFRWLGVFVAGASLEALVAVSRMSEDAVLTGLVALLDASLLQCVESDGTRRYTQLVTLQAYAQERLREEGEWEEARKRHAAYFADLVGMLVPDGSNQPERIMPLVEAEYDNVRAALAWALETGAIMHGLRMVGALRRFWASHSHYMEGLEWLERFIPRAEVPRTDDERAVIAEAWTGMLVLCHRLDQFERARAAGETALTLWREVGDAKHIAAAMMNLANPITQLGDFEQAAALFQESLALYRQMNDRQGMVFPLMNLGWLYYERGQPQKALESYEESLALSRELGESDWARGLTWNNVGEAYIALDEPARAVEVTEPSYRTFLSARDVFGTATCAFTLGRAHWRLGDAEAARAYLDESEHLFRTLGNLVMAARSLHMRASVALGNGDILGARRDLAQALAGLTGQPHGSAYLWLLAERVGSLASRASEPQIAARLYGAAMAHRDETSGLVEPAEREMRAGDVERLRDTLGEHELANCLATGRELDLGAVVALMRTVLQEDGVPAATYIQQANLPQGG